MINIQNLKVEFNTRALFDGVSCVINQRDRIALVGRNGAGKTTMLRIIAGELHPTSGTVSMPGGTTVGYLPQQMPLTDTRTLIEEASLAFSHIDKMRRRLEEMNTALAERTDYESAAYLELIDRISVLSEQLAIEEGENQQAELERTLQGLGFKRSDFSRPTAEFSGGWRMRIELAKLLLSHPDVLLLDEPTNHLDIESIQWLEQFLQTYRGAVVLVSHDRAFINNVTNRTIEISVGKIYDYAVSYDKFMTLRRERIEQQTRAYLNQQKQIAETEAFIERFRYKATKSVQVQSRLKQLSKIERIEIDNEDTSHLNLRFPPAPRSGDYPVIAQDVGKSFGEHKVFEHADFTLKRGDKVAFVGKNGMGKSTMVKCIIGELEHTGTLRLGHNVKIGYFAQNQAQMLDGELTVFDTIDRVAVGDIRTKIRDILGAFMFGGEASDKKVKVLSGGEKTRLAMIKLLLEPVNLLILDEPTNHLDMPSKDVLKQAIKEFSGTVIVVSHDREFLDGLVDKVYEFTEGGMKENLGGIYDFLQKKRIDTLSQLDARPSVAKNDNERKPTPQAAKPADKPRINYAEQREREKMRRRARKKVEEAEADVSAKEQVVKEIEQKLSEGNTDPELYTAHQQATRALENAMSVWELACMELEELG